MNGLKTGLGITPGEHIISADSALSRNIRHCFCLSVSVQPEPSGQNLTH
ncbi:malate transporter [Escherichia coli]|nr:malate transporter [Escherichia coli]HEI2791158.1 malate transporter [Escherichia coli]HEI3622156.1 malate transporter [Escherichia coli]HEI3672434.1 malate transporter [Escherichia coli]HEI4217531.1 malate transporter [Escherichia coli]